MNKNNITKIVIKNSVNIYKSETIDNKQKINEFIKLTNSDVVKLGKKNGISNGSTTSVYFYTTSKHPTIIYFIGTSDLAINGEYYKIIKGDLTLDKNWNNEH
ncbi:hypothetical protein [Clostridium estertheticum]|uniref:hypothetical protein n=1 Tax=Clostridium estertheticum TaxID=238834 RepID=UPI001C7DC3BC|nr:hypothetical protein [Clostridium estertheticum]MBX4268498.1 hypothetical protein [Clostridium estertheticum]WLC81444.1 hypothetical protein KTC98_09615 [Clostridium estertheticum]